MKPKLIFVMLILLAAAMPLLAQVSTKTGTIYGKVVDEKSAALPGVTVTLESEMNQSQVATTGPTGGFRFANLSPGKYSATFSIEGFTEVRQEDVQVSVGGSVQLEITLKPKSLRIMVPAGDSMTG